MADASSSAALRLNAGDVYKKNAPQKEPINPAQQRVGMYWARFQRIQCQRMSPGSKKREMHSRDHAPYSPSKNMAMMLVLLLS